MDINPDSINPSAEWTDEERKALVIKITNDMQDFVLKSNHSLISSVYLTQCAGRINFLMTASKGFLETNRNTILNGTRSPMQVAIYREERTPSMSNQPTYRR